MKAWEVNDGDVVTCNGIQFQVVGTHTDVSGITGISLALLRGTVITRMPMDDDIESHGFTKTRSIYDEKI